ncbi:hypothetical protein GCM10023189_25610 [Nibrella saemangeumensis]|uniref:DUF4249 domain-containing protein n=1 Tax=Nibrella saemangeumensis TaxID=1084526 RepID=A0ABP8MXG7_9BACT
MKYYSLFLLAIVGSLIFSSCETVIEADLDEGPEQLSVDAIITDQPGVQTIRLTKTAPYLANRPTPAATGAVVTVTDNTGRIYQFTDPDNDGNYTWQPTTTDTLGQIGRTYVLRIQYQGEEYQSLSRMNRVPTVDSIIFRKEKVSPLPNAEEGYQAEFFARDPAGAPDYARIRFFRNGVLQNRPNDLVVTYDGAFNGSGNTDGLLFIRPIRQSINPENFYAENDTVTVEIQSITPEAFYFFLELREQVSNGGLFATPPANVPTNVVNANASGPKATGFFIASAVRNRTVRVSQEAIRD